jgi:hypothetical protein
MKVYFWFLLFLNCACSEAMAQATDHSWRLAMVGDVMLGSDYPAPLLPPNHGVGLLDAAAPVLQGADLALGNLEGTFGRGGASSKGGCERCFVFRMPPELAPRLREAGFGMWSSANNHAHDFGAAGQQQTRRALLAAGMSSTGALDKPAARVQVRGRTACLLAFAPNAGMHDLRNISQAVALIKSTRQSCDLLLVSFHGGGEGTDKSHTPMGTEYYLGENRGDVRRFARAAIDAGADLVFGHSPHIPRGMELYQHKLIAYSLGNFMTYGRISVAGALGVAPLLEVTLDSQGRLQSGAVHSFRQEPLHALRVDKQGTAARMMAQLTREDFAGGGLVFENGAFYPQKP